MKCPYLGSSTSYEQSTFEHDENGIQTSRSNIFIETIKLMDCLNEECAEWKEGECKYNAG